MKIAPFIAIALLPETPVWAHSYTDHDHFHQHVRDLRANGGNNGNGRPRSCGTKELSRIEKKDNNQKFQNWKNKNKPKGSGRMRGLQSGQWVDVPTVFHIIAETNGGAGSEAINYIDAQMEVMNERFRPYKFRFILKQPPTITVNRKWFKVDKFTDELDMKQSLRVGDGSVLNVYVNTASDYLGWAYFPTILGTDEEVLDGVVIDYQSLPGGNCSPDLHEGCGKPNSPGCCDYAYNLGMTMVHEIGHWLMLDHVFNGGCDCVGDTIDDTPRMAEETRGCPVGKDTCPEDKGLDPITNYMDYSEDSCYEEFTRDQVERMHFAWEAYRLTDGDIPPYADADIPDPDPCGANDSDGKELVVELLTDIYGSESLWELVDTDSGNEVLSSEGRYQSSTAYTFGPYCLQPGNYRFDFHDTFGDGICCDYGEGSLVLKLGGDEIYNGGDFDDCLESIEFSF